MKLTDLVITEGLSGTAALQLLLDLFEHIGRPMSLENFATSEYTPTMQQLGQAMDMAMQFLQNHIKDSHSADLAYDAVGTISRYIGSDHFKHVIEKRETYLRAGIDEPPSVKVSMDALQTFYD